MQSIAAQDNASELAPHPHRLTLRGRASSADFPPLCPNCGSAATQRIEYSKVFRETDSDGPTRYVVSSVSVPFCDACIASHRAQEIRPTLAGNVLSSFATMDMLGAVFPAMAAVFLAWLALGDLLHGRGTRFLVELGIGAVFALIAWAQGHAVWQQTDHLRVPPQTDITKAFDFSDDSASSFEAARYVCTMRNERFANAFRILNLDREWLPNSPEAVAERRRTNRLVWIFGIVIAVFAVWDLFR